MLRPIRVTPKNEALFLSSFPVGPKKGHTRRDAQVQDDAVDTSPDVRVDNGRQPSGLRRHRQHHLLPERLAGTNPRPHRNIPHSPSISPQLVIGHVCPPPSMVLPHIPRRPVLVSLSESIVNPLFRRNEAPIMLCYHN
jgi:hypothetical protein